VTTAKTAIKDLQLFAQNVKPSNRHLERNA